MLVSMVVNTLLVLLGYYLGLRKARDDIQGMINSNVELQEVWSRLLIEEAGRAKKEATGDAEAPPEPPEVEEATEPPEIIDGRVFKLFNQDHKKH